MHLCVFHCGGNVISKFLKQFLWLIFPASMGMFLLASFVYSGEIAKQRISFKENERSNVALAQASIDRELYATLTDLQFLTNFAAGRSLKQVSESFSLFAIDKKIYDQIRLLSVDGMERLRINYRSKKAEVVPVEGLQSKKERYYFKESINLKRGEVFISPLDLNIERGIVERPLKPMIRLGMPVFDGNGMKTGVVILNFLARDMLKRFRERAENLTGSFRLINADGFWLSHEKWEKEWGFMLEREDLIQNQHGKEWLEIKAQENGQFETSEGLFSFATVYPIKSIQKKNYFWKIVAHVPVNYIREQQYEQLRLTIFVAGPLYFALLAICAWLAHSRVQRKIAEKALRISEEQNRAIIEMSVDAIISTNAKGEVESWNPAAKHLFGYSEKEALGHDIGKLVIPEADRAVHDQAMKIFPETGRTGLLGHRVERIAMCKSGRHIPVDIAVVAQKSEDKLMLTAFIQDLTQRKKNEQRDRLTKAVFDETLECINICDADNKIVMANKAFTAVTGYRLRDVLDKDPSMLASGKHDQAFYNDMWASIYNKGNWVGEIWNRHKDGRVYPARISIAVVRDRNGEVQNFIAVFNDITEEKETEEAIRKQAHYDTLTNLPNRLLFMDRLNRSVVEAKRSGEVFALMFIDLDRFKPVNDTYGHQVGDALLIEVARRLEAGVRESDTVARLAGDEFTIIARRLNGEEDLRNIVAKIDDSLCGLWEYDDIEINISGSIGYALFPTEGDNATNLLHSADEAMYRVKEAKHKDKDKE